MARHKFNKKIFKSFLLAAFVFLTPQRDSFHLEAASLNCSRGLSFLIQKFQVKIQGRQKLNSIRAAVRESVKSQNDFHLVYLNRDSNRWEVESFSPLDAQLLLNDGIKEGDSVRIPGQEHVYSWLDFLLSSEVSEEQIGQWNLKLKLEEDATKIRQKLVFPAWAVAPGASSRRVQALKNVLGILDSGRIPLLKQIQVHDPAAYQNLKTEILDFVKDYFLSDNPGGVVSVVNGSLNQEDLYVIEKDARDFVKHLHQMTGDADFDPDVVFEEEIRVRSIQETAEQKHEREILEDWILKFRIRLGILAKHSNLEEVRKSFFSKNLLDEFRYLKRNIERIQPGVYQSLRQEVVQFIKTSLVEKGKGPDMELIEKLEHFGAQVEDPHFLPERVFFEDLGRLQDASRSPYLLYKKLSTDLKSALDEDKENPKRSLRSFIVNPKTLETAQKLSNRDSGAEFKKALASKLKQEVRRLKIYEDFVFDDALQEKLLALSVILGDPDIMTEDF